MTSEELQSKTIDFMRFPLIVGVVFIHFNIGYDSFYSFPGIDWNDNPMWLNYLVCCLSKVLPTFAVPMFYTIAGYYFFYHKGVPPQPTLTYTDFIQKFHKRIKTLLIPFIVWNMLYVLGQIGGALIGGHEIHCSISAVLLTLWDATIQPLVPTYHWLIGEGPIDTPLWFIKDLILLVLTTPIIYYLTKKIRGYIIVGVFTIWIILRITLPFNNNVMNFLRALCFFCIGAYLSISGKNCVVEARKIKYMPLIYPFFVAINTYLLVATPFVETIPHIGLLRQITHTIGVIIGMITFTNIVSYLYERQRIHLSPFLTRSVFFILAAHWAILLPCMSNLVFHLLGQSNNPIVMVVWYFTTILFTIVTCLGIYWLLQRFCPRTCALLTGSR